MKARSLALLTLILIAIASGGCDTPKVPKQVVVYTALDEEFSRPIFDAFTRKTGIEVLAKFDTEATKTVGLASAIMAERERPRADVFWNNELLHTLRLKREGLLRSQPMAADKNYDPEYRSKDLDWRGFAARARVLIVNTNLVKEARWPHSIEDLTDPQWYDQAGVAKPLFGTTATQAACLFEQWGDERAKKFFTGVKKNCRILSGNKRVAQEVARGKLAFGLTDTDDAMIELEGGQPVTIIYPDQPKEEGQEALGTLFIPNTIALVEGSPNPTAGHALAEFLLTSLVECRLVIGPSAQIPLSNESRSDNACRCRVKTPEEVQPMAVNWEAAAAGWDDASKWLAEEFGGAL
ncbi:putative binding protein component of ABC iron transporter precursor [Botrimarina colliarenosi]|uniref:Putative binding protein component of ABC iron transporter n=1 Tax=Botrimarina colliarenosi TaxID=2528001 RepID=A0A5C6A9Z9_9BACT|nr:extracellular solute-binding protein [Botrimarina colliarenosi]TWT96852.1 putative binding protein component of ABC iron transporter precursor [Botrimarina colliarenosi]